MKIAFVCTEKLPVPPVLGGAIQIYIEGVLPILSKHHEITVFSLQNSNLPNVEKKGNVKYIRVKGRTRTEYVNNVRDELTDEFDLVHVFNRPRWVPILSKSLPNTAFSLSLHNEMMLPKKIDSQMGQECVDRVEFITTVSKFIADGVKSLYPSAENKLKPVYSATDANKIKPFWSEDVIQDRINMRKQYGLENSKVILYVGRLSVKKGPHVLVEAMKEVMDSHPNTSLVFVGSKWYGNNATDEYIKKLQNEAKGLKNPVVFTGFLTPYEIPKYYNIGDIFVCTSQWEEPLARVHYEAMAAGLPIITTDRGGNAEVIEEGVNGFAIKDYDNPQAFAKHIKYLLDNEDEAINMGKMGRKFAVEKHNWEIIANRLLKLFESIKGC
ncbi:glycosyltransferase family 4 protein [Tepidibacter formicigenes]|jgi:spore coat protein SA|uniref:Spore coat protein SA n=1 Tax=Tepidibacter formicigenes DSM 15518 TaxID=1123349 RepID=A0A1M6N142_9FIRM|nr:glycosyltransferase family 4 protein [Tepidibacter formicigenes]SHJ89405.1 spore coat protein SA [Tepidibacter formicigenes DSM 15518]